MEKLASESTIVDATNGVDLTPSPGASRARRRLVQSTLFPHRSQENAVGEEEDCDQDEDQDDDEEEYCGSQSRKKRKRKPKAVAQSRASRKVTVNGEETLSKRMGDEDSPVIVKSDFFLKVSERRHQKRPQKEQLCAGSPDENDKTCSPQDFAANAKSPRQLKRRANATPEKRRMNSTPKKNVVNSGHNEACSGHMLDNPTQSEHTLQPIPDLRLEAKMTAEENSRIFAGRQIHPFFSSWKMGKRNQETDDVESKWCSIEEKDENITFSAIHVFEKIQDDAFSLDWGSWKFSEGSFFNSSCGLESTCSPIYEGSINSLQFDNFLNISHPPGTSLCQNEGCSDLCPIQLEEASLGPCPIQQENFPAISSTLLADEQLAHSERLMDIEVDHEMEQVDSFLEHVGCVQNSNVEWQGIFLPERMMSYYNGCGNQLENSLWTNKYQPEKATEICGNSDSVKFLSEWLHLWHEKGSRTSKNSSNGDKWIVQAIDYNCNANDCDSEDIDEEASLKNVLLVTGPVGSGKSAAIYACAKEQGFQVIEVNASDWRNGALVKQRFGEAVESHWLKRAMENSENSDKRHLLKCSSAACNATAAQMSENEVIELIPLSDEEDSQNASGKPRKSTCKENRTATSAQSEIKTLILFEDVDATIYEDRGFTATIQQLAETAKRPMILTSNSDNPVLPNNLDRLEVCFKIPSPKELLCLVYMICISEKAKIEPCLVEQFIGSCQRDIRKTIMHLQFWCQGQSQRKDCEVQRTYGPLIFDLDAGHRILPKIIPCGCPSQLSEIVEKEITKSLLMVEENSSSMDIVEEELNIDELRMPNIEPNSIEAKKEAMLSRHCSDQDGNEFAIQFGTTCEFSNSSGSPVAFTRRNTYRKPTAVLSSESEEECLSDGFPVVPGKLFEDINNEALPEVNSKSLSHCLATEKFCNPLTEVLLHSDGEMLGKNCFHSSERANYSHVNGTCKSVDVSCVKFFNPLTEELLHFDTELLEENCSHSSESAYYSHVNGTCKLVDVSCVPESSFVPETEISNEAALFSRTVSCGHFDDRVEAAFTTFTSSDLIPKIVENNFNQSSPGLHKIPEMLGNSCDVITESVPGEEVGDSHIERVEAVPREHQVMDECSRMDFSRRSKSMEEARSLVTDVVQETWRKLRHCHTDLRKHVTLEQRDACQILKLAYGMSDLISEADLLLSDCQPLICDYLGPSLVPCEKPHSFSWYDDQLQMTSIIAQHGMCLYAKEIAAVGSNTGSAKRMDLALEMLASSTNTMALGKLVSQDRRLIRSLEMGPPKSGISLESELESCLCNIVQSIVPSRSYLALKGDAFHEYLSSLGKISRLEASRLLKSIDKSKKRRVRVARNYLSTGALALSSEEISLLGQYNCYQKVSSQSMDASLR